jgi:hypothetical protein
MSHWTVCKTQIKDLKMMKRAAMRLGVEVLEGSDLKLESAFQKAQDVVMLFKYKDGVAGIVKGKSGYELSIDNFYNPICELVGEDCKLLGREYSKMLVEQQALMMNGVVSQSTILENGSVEMVISIY